MKHEVRCIEIPCTCVTILQEKVKNLEAGHYILNKALNESTEREISLRKKIEDGLSCCCSGCTKHNLQIQGNWTDSEMLDFLIDHQLAVVKDSEGGFYVTDAADTYCSLDPCGGNGRQAISLKMGFK